MTAGEIDRLIVTCPPRHGKTEQGTVRYPAFRLERDPAMRILLAAYNQTLAKKFSRKVRKICAPRLLLSAERNAAEEWETVQGGGIRAAGVGIGITGMGFNLIDIDDPIKGRAQANSEAFRNSVWDWYCDDLLTRLEPGGSIILTLTRWHEDDLAGRILASVDGPNWTVVNLPAVAEEGDPLGRPVGAALCPERYDEAALERIRKARSHASWTSLFQQRPTAQDGDMFQRPWFTSVGAIPAGARLVRYWDKAATQDGGCYTAGVLIAKAEGLFFIVDVVRGQWSPGNREKMIRETAVWDRLVYGHGVKTWVEEEGGSGGPESADNTVRNLAGFSVGKDRVAGTGDKYTRAIPFADQAEAGNVRLVREAEGRTWHAAYLAELLAAPNGKFKDQVDATSGGFNKLNKSVKLEFN